MNKYHAQLANLWLVGVSQDSRDLVETVQEESLVVVTAPDAETAIAAYIRRELISDEVLFEHVATGGYLPMVKYEDEDDVFAACPPAEVIPALRAFFAEHTAWAKIALAHYNDPNRQGAAEEVAGFPPDMLVYIVQTDPSWTAVVAIPLAEMSVLE